MKIAGSEFHSAVWRAAVLPLALLALLSVVLLSAVVAMRDLTSRVDRADRILARGTLVEGLAIDQETGLRGYLLTGDEVFLEPYGAADRKLVAVAEELRTLVSDRAQIARLQDTFVRLADWRRAYAEDQISRRRSGASGEVIARLASEGKARMDGVRGAISAFLDAEERLRGERLGRVERLARVSLALTILLVVLVAFTLSFGAVRTLRRMGSVFDEALRARDDFIAVAAHELKNPLTAFRLQVETLSRVVERSGPEVSLTRIERGVSAMQRSAGRFVELVNRLLDVSRLSAGELRLDVKELDLSQVVAECLERMRVEVERAGSTVELRAEPSVGQWDRLRVESVVTNLLSNAVKYGLGRPIEISVQEVSGNIRLSVRDHGIGIPLEDQARIFGRYERAVSAGAYDGLGIGLWLTRAIVEAHDGTIQVESRPGEGTTFVVQLPRMARARPDAPRRRPYRGGSSSPFEARGAGCGRLGPRGERALPPAAFLTSRSAPPPRADRRA